MSNEAIAALVDTVLSVPRPSVGVVITGLGGGDVRQAHAHRTDLVDANGRLARVHHDRNEVVAVDLVAPQQWRVDLDDLMTRYGEPDRGGPTGPGRGDEVVFRLSAGELRCRVVLELDVEDRVERCSVDLD